jgi:hypothetical protein
MWKGYCKAAVQSREFGEFDLDSILRCIDVPMNVCRMKPIDIRTGKPVKRKFVVPREGVTACWWKEGGAKEWEQKDHVYSKRQKTIKKEVVKKKQSLE